MRFDLWYWPQTQDKIDEVGREISKATQQSSGLTIE